VRDSGRYYDVPCLLPRWIRGDRLTVKEDERIVPGYALDFHSLLVEKAEVETVNEIELTVFRGGITEVYDSLGFSRAHYSRVVKVLEDIGAMEIIQRGNPRQQTVVVLYAPPTIEALSQAYLLTSPSNLRKMSHKTLDGRVSNLEGRLGTGINYVDALVNIEARLQALERKAGIHGKKS
jgi:hypothetical protein